MFTNGLFCQTESEVFDVRRKVRFLFGVVQPDLGLFIKDNLKNPSPELGCMEGTVYVGFVVETDGRLTDIQAKRSFYPDFSVEALRIVNLMQGKWKAGKQSGKPVRAAYTIPIKFRLE
jgi:TonB family protein